MLRKRALLLLLFTAVVFAEGDSPGKLPESTVLRMLNKHQSSGHKARSQWAYHALDDSYRQASEGISHGYAAHPQGLTLRATEGHSEYPTYSSSVAEYWRPSSANLTVSSNAYTYSRPYSASTSSGSGSYSKDALRGTHSMFQYHQSRPSQTTTKKIHPHYLIGKLHNSDGSAKTKYKKTILYQSPSVPATYKKLVHPRVHKPYAKHKYPTQKTVHPAYRRYYQSPYQRYAIPFSDILRHKLSPQSDYSQHKTSGSSPTPSSDSYHTTERMDDAYPDGSAPSDDYSPYNDTHYNASTNYYDAFDEPDKTNDPDPSYDETTTRGYYGDRIYMSTQLPLTSPDKPTTRNSYFILRRTSDDDDIETIFE